MRKVFRVVGLITLFLIMMTVLIGKPKTTKRSEIPEKYKWNLSDIYPSWEEWEKDFNLLEKKMDEFAALKGTLDDSPEAFLHAFQLNDELGMLAEKVYRYPSMTRDIDTRNQEISAKFQQVQILFSKFGTATAWFNPELLSIPREKIDQWMKAKPELQIYAHMIDNLFRQQEHVLDEEKETLLSYFSRFSGTPRSIHSELSTSDIKFREAFLTNGDTVTITPGQYRYIISTNRNQEDRRRAFEARNEAYYSTINTYAAIYNSICQRDWAFAQARNYSSTLEASLDDDNVPVDVYMNLIQTVKSGVEPLQKYHRIRQKALGLDEYHLYDSAIPVVDFDKNYEFDDVTDYVISAVKPLGKDYISRVKRALSGGWIDVYENEGKRGGAYSAGVYGVHPYMLLNYSNTMDDVFTLAHEMGHTIHTLYSQEFQPYATSDYTIFVAEVASTMNEALLLDFMLEESGDPLEKIALLSHAIDNIAGTFYTQVMFADFELQAHQLAEQGKPITAKVLNDLYGNLLLEYYGDSITHDELYKITWARIPHFYFAPYYVYQYATCFASSAKIHKGLTDKHRKTRKQTLNKYLELLKSGGNDYPMEQLKKAGVDLTDPNTIRAVIEQMDELVSKLEVELNKL